MGRTRNSALEAGSNAPKEADGEGPMPSTRSREKKKMEQEPEEDGGKNKIRKASDGSRVAEGGPGGVKSETVAAVPPPAARGWCRSSPELAEYYERVVLAQLERQGIKYTVSQVSLAANSAPPNTDPPSTDEEMSAAVHSIHEGVDPFADLHINTLEVLDEEDASAHAKPPLVLVHGLGGGLGMFVKNLAGLRGAYRVFAIDMLGFGRSSHPPFPSDGAGAEELFASSLERWREAMGLPSLVLCAHSFGAYVATAYALQHPARCQALILMDPWGFPHPDPEIAKKRSMGWRLLGHTLLAQNPVALLRALGPAGLPLISWLRRDVGTRFGGESMLRYLYHVNVQEESGDRGFHALMAPFAFAKRPMLDRVHMLDEGLPVTFLYGSRSWISSRTGEQARALRPPTASTTVEIIEDAGHQMYGDQPSLTNEAIIRVLTSGRVRGGGGLRRKTERGDERPHQQKRAKGLRR